MTQNLAVLCATLDTKGEEALFLKKELETCGIEVYLIDIGLRRTPSQIAADCTQDEVAAAAGSVFEHVEAAPSRSKASEIMAKGLIEVVRRLHSGNKLGGMISLGGSGGTTIAAAAMRALPLGVPKLIVGTMAAGNTLPYTQGLDILMLNSVVDVQSLNFLSRHILTQAAQILAAMMKAPALADAGRTTGKNAVAVTCFGVTTPCVLRCRALLEKEGYEVVIFHARGVSGGGLMERMVREGLFRAVLDVTTTEVIDEVAGGAYAVPGRLNAAAEADIPCVVVPGALEMINIGPEERLRPDQAGRIRYYHTPDILKIRADAKDMERAAEIFSQRLGKSQRKTRLTIPMSGFSAVDAPGEVFFDPEADETFAREIERLMPSTVPVVRRACHINDPAFADYIVRQLLDLLDSESK